MAVSNVGWCKGVFIVAAIATASVVPGFGSPVGTLSLRATVANVVELSVNPTGAASALDLALDATDLLVATVGERSNGKQGFTVTLSSANALAARADAPFLKGADALSRDTVGYTMSYGGMPVRMIAGVARVSDESTRTPPEGVRRSLTISYTGAATSVQAGAYGDTLTFTIAAK